MRLQSGVRPRCPIELKISDSPQLKYSAAAARIIDLVREASIDRLKTHGQRPQVDLEIVEPKLSVQSHWMVLILLAGDGGKLTLKAHYSAKDIRALISRALDRDEASVHDGLISDFMKEYLNLTAGAVKARLSEVGIYTGLSIPIVTRGFDEVWRRSGEAMIENYWRLVWATGSLGLSIAFREGTWPDAVNIPNEAKRDDDLEFL